MKSATGTALTLPQHVRISDVEAVLASPSNRKTIEIDARQIQTLNVYSAAILASWLGSLAARGKTVRVKLPPRDALIDDARRILLDKGLLHLLERLGVIIDYSGPAPDAGLGLRSLSPDGDRSELLTAIATHLMSQLHVPSADLLVADITHTVLFELLDNAVIHAGAEGAYFGIDVLPAHTVRDDPLLPAHARAEEYVDVVVGDAGRGLLAQLESLLPRDYAPPFQTSHRFTRSEQILAFGFEFGSTSDDAARRSRLEALLGSAIDPRTVATGLSCVLNVVRQRHGSLVLRSGSAVLGVDYSRGWEATPSITGASTLRLKCIRSVPGTHFILRFPVKRLTVKRGAVTAMPESALIDGMRLIDPWRGDFGRSETDVLADALGAIDKEVRAHRRTPGATVLRRSTRPVSSRARALFGAGLASLHRGVRHLVCLDDYFTSFDSPHPEFGSDFLPATESGSILTGDLFRNEFREVHWGGARVPPHLAELLGHGPDVRLTRRVFDAALRLHARALVPELQAALRSPHARLVGRFEIDQRYFATVFYAVSSVLDDPRLRQRFAEWMTPLLDGDCDVIIAAAAPVVSLAHALADLAQLTRPVRPQVVSLSSHDLAPGALLRHVGRKAFVITDVICTGKSIRTVLDGLAGLTIHRVVTIVDARSDASRGLGINVGVSDVPVTSVIEDTVALSGHAVVQSEPSGQLRLLPSPAAAGAGATPVIDNDTHRPTIYVRPVTTRLSIDELISAATESGALRYGHSEFGNRHYSVFLHLPRLFGHLRVDMEKWITSLVGGVPRAASASWRVMILAVDTSFAWAVDFCAQILPEARIGEITWSHLKAPDPPLRDERVRSVLVLAPASASGETARRAIEFASRGEPDDIYLLVGVSRMEPSHLSFLTTLRHYRASRLHVDFFTSFTVRGYQIGKVSCPICRQVARLDLLRDSVQPEILRALDDKARTLAPWTVDHESPTFYFAATPGDQQRTQLRAMYEAAEFDDSVRRALSSLLSRDVGARDRFLEIVSLERASEHFELNAMRGRLGGAFVDIAERATELLWTAVPPFPLTRVLDALIHLDEQTFLRASARLLEAYLVSPHDLDELCVALCELRYWPTVDVTFFESLAASPDAATIVRSTQTAVAAQRAERRDFPILLRHLGRIRTILARSSHFYDRLDRLAKRAALDPPPLRPLCDELYDAWSRELLPNITYATAHPAWIALCRRRTRLSSSLQELSASITRVRMLAKEAFRSDPVTLAAQLAAVATEALRAASSFVDSFTELIISPLNSSLSAIPAHFVACDGALVTVERHIDFDVPRVFCSMADLNDAIDEVMSNWIKFKDRPDAAVGLHVRAEADAVVIAFEDNFSGRVDERSDGGWRMLKGLCRDYGGDLRLREHGEFKSVEMWLQPIDNVAHEEV